MKYSSDMSDDRLIEALLAAVDDVKVESKADGCDVVQIACFRCRGLYWEEADYAKACIVIGVSFLCLQCDNPKDTEPQPVIIYSGGGALW